MGKSYKKHPSIKYSDSDKDDKVKANRKFRRTTKRSINSDTEDAADLPTNIREVSDVWGFASDGGSYYVSPKEANQNNDWKKWCVRK